MERGEGAKSRAKLSHNFRRRGSEDSPRAKKNQLIAAAKGGGGHRSELGKEKNRITKTYTLKKTTTNCLGFEE